MKINSMQISANRIHYLTDYIDERYLFDESELKKDIRENTVFYNYKKQGEELPVIMENNPDINWVPIRNMTQEQIIEQFRKGKIYVDFGTHPGKDRLPREAASCGLCILTNREGAAQNDTDVPIANEYKFERPLEQSESIINKIRDIFDNYSDASDQFYQYREWIRSEKRRFSEEVKTVSDILAGDKETIS